MIFFLLSGVHIGIVMAAVGFLGISYLNGWFAGLMVLKTVPFTTFANYSMSVVPLFILMGAICFHTGISQELYQAVNKWIGHLRGGLAMDTIRLRRFRGLERVFTGHSGHYGNRSLAGNGAL